VRGPLWSSSGSREHAVASERLTALLFLPPAHPSFPTQAARNCALALQVTTLSCYVAKAWVACRSPTLPQAVARHGWWEAKGQAARASSLRMRVRRRTKWRARALPREGGGSHPASSRAAWVAGACASIGMGRCRPSDASTLSLPLPHGMRLSPHHHDQS